MGMFRKTMAALVFTAVAGFGLTASANEFRPEIETFMKQEIMGWLSDPAVISAIKAQNEKHASISDGDIDTLDKTWRAEAKAGGGDLTAAVLGNDLSKLLKTKKDAAGGKIAEMFIMDNKGLNVGQSDMTSDYMQGDEAKWQKTFSQGAGAMFIDEVEFDDSSKAFQSQASVTIVDESGKPIGAITVGVNVEKL
ncbi:hypothetical protein GH722_02010 [Alphaproteobacteria bacterium HT1-32]|nr:hypothetical protein [Alphaproteobacteria bacterium HT1-32]